MEIHPLMYLRNQQINMTASPDKYPQGFFKDKPCANCEKVFSPQAPSHKSCSPECSDEMSTSRYLTRCYGITLKDYMRMLQDQKGLCKICNGVGFKMAEHHKLQLVVDHCHSSGKVRGLLCHNCNRALGLLQDNVKSLQAAIDYLNTEEIQHG